LTADTLSCGLLLRPAVRTESVGAVLQILAAVDGHVEQRGGFAAKADEIALAAPNYPTCTVSRGGRHREYKGGGGSEGETYPSFMQSSVFSTSDAQPDATDGGQARPQGVAVHWHTPRLSTSVTQSAVWPEGHTILSAHATGLTLAWQPVTGPLLVGLESSADLDDVGAWLVGKVGGLLVLVGRGLSASLLLVVGLGLSASLLLLVGRGLSARVLVVKVLAWLERLDVWLPAGAGWVKVTEQTGRSRLPMGNPLTARQRCGPARMLYATLTRFGMFFASHAWAAGIPPGPFDRMAFAVSVSLSSGSRW